MEPLKLKHIITTIGFWKQFIGRICVDIFQIHPNNHLFCATILDLFIYSKGRLKQKHLQNQNWLVVEPTPFEKYDRQNGFIFPK